jgi:UDP-4-amino-4,6-dideoxy-N-acetyl-beta-L-altrosamine transaminase
MSRLACEGGKPVRGAFLPYGRHAIDAADLAAVRGALRSGALTQGPACGRFEAAFAETVGAPHAIALSSGTAALHAAIAMLDLRPGDEVIVPPITFAATANAVLYAGARPVFADVDPTTGLINPAAIEKNLSRRTRAIVPVHFAGSPCPMRAIRKIARAHDLALVVDAAHALGSVDHGTRVGTGERLCIFSTHPVKHVTTGEGGVVTTTSRALRDRLLRFRSHGIRKDPLAAVRRGAWFYEMVELGYNYRLPDFAAALGLSQLAKLDAFVARRRRLAARYRELLADREYLDLVPEPEATESAVHIFPVLLRPRRFRVPKRTLVAALHAENIGVQVHYVPVHLHPYYRTRLGTRAGLCPRAEGFYRRELTLPLFPGMTTRDQDDVVDALDKVHAHFAR